MRVLTGVLLTLVLVGCASEHDGDAHAWFDASAVEEHRRAKDDAFRSTPDSPIPAEGRAAFGGLRYFPIDARFAVDATFRAEASPDTVMLGTTHGDDVRPALRAGTLVFTLGSTKHRLTVYQILPLDARHYFVAFQDSTSGIETYHGGRYLEVAALDESAPVKLDFNMAYNPYCAYNADYSCPLVPAENRLAASIRAGERTWK